MRHLIAVLFVILVIAVPWAMYNPQQVNFIFSTIQSIENQLAAVILNHNPKTISEIKSRYNDSGILNVNTNKVRILLVPGHEPDYGGAEYGSLKEREMTVELAKYLQQFLQKNKRYEVIVTRNESKWDTTFENYWKSDWNDIIAWQKGHAEEIAEMKRIGSFSSVAPKVIHNKAPQNVALRLSGIGKWANENNVDIIIHVHINDVPGHAVGVPGKYSGFSIYVPQEEYYNSVTTKALADSIFRRLQKFNAVSDLRGESEGIIESQDLIAIGANNSIDAASMLIEYGYIYEPQFANTDLRSQSLKDLAYQTYLGLQDFFDPYNVVKLSNSFDTLVIPYKWNNTMTGENNNIKDIFALQTVLTREGFYPPKGKSLNDCPRTGTIGSCTKAAIKDFQKKYNINGEEGIVGTKTIDMLNKLYGVTI